MSELGNDMYIPTDSDSEEDQKGFELIFLLKL